MNWMEWAVLIWIVLALGAVGLIGFWIGRAMDLQDEHDARWGRPVVPGKTPLADLMNDEYSQTLARTARRTDTVAITAIDVRA